MRMTTEVGRTAVLAAGLPALSGCATLAQLGLQAPQFSVDNTQPAQLAAGGPSFGHPQGGAAIRLFARVRNPNPVGLTLARLAGGLPWRAAARRRSTSPWACRCRGTARPWSRWTSP